LLAQPLSPLPRRMLLRLVRGQRTVVGMWGLSRILVRAGLFRMPVWRRWFGWVMRI
jgi:hypothetical protein